MKEKSGYKRLKNIKIFFPKRKYNKPRYSNEVSPGVTSFLTGDGYQIIIINNDPNNKIFWRYE